MNDVLDPPAERDLPPGCAARMRRDVLRAVARPAPRRRSMVTAAVATAAAVAIAAAGIATQTRTASPDGPRLGTLVALGPNGAPAALDGLIAQCADLSSNPRGLSAPIAVTRANLAVSVVGSTNAALLFLTDDGYVTCDVNRIARGASFGQGLGIGVDRWGVQRDWLPGPFQVLSHVRTTLEGGDVTASGRVGPRVDRLSLEWGEGRRVDATVDDGVFGLQVDTGDVTEDAELVAYDRTGAEIGRRSMDLPLYEFDPCYADPAGRVVYDRIPPAPAEECRPAEPWGR
jgi:hypothetical protein